MNRILIAILLLMFVVLNCSNRGVTTIDARLIISPLDTDPCMSISGFNTTGFDIRPVATLNGETLCGTHFEYGKAHFDIGTYLPWIHPGDECRLVVDYGSGVFEATERLPDNVTITSPDTDFVLYRYDDLTINWEPAVGAEWFVLYVSADYTYFDNTGQSHLHHFSCDIATDQYTYTISAGEIFPDFVKSLDEHCEHLGKVWLVAKAGPWVEHADIDQTSAADTGFFWCEHWMEPIYFQIDQEDE